MRRKIWIRFMALAQIPQGMILPWWARVVRACLFPLDAFYWRMSRTRGYDPMRDTWTIEGVTYSAALLHQFANAKGETIRISRSGDVVTFERVPNS